MQKQKVLVSTKTLAYCAMLVALGVVLSRLAGVMPNEFSRYSIGMVPTFLAGLLFGPVPGVLVGFAADFVGCLFSPYPYNPIFCVSPILYGLIPGLLHWLLLKNNYSEKKLLLSIAVGYFLAMGLGSVLYMSAAMAWVYSPDAFQARFVLELSKRAIQYAVVLAVDSAITWLLFRTKLFERMGVWPPKYKKNVNEAIAYIHSNFWKGSTPGLTRTQTLLAKMGNPEKKLKFVHIAGTNGKGSTAAMTASILQKAGYRVGLYTSPYIYRFHERMQVNGVEISDGDLIAVTEFVRPLAQSMDQKPTEFELVCCIAFEYFVRQNCDIVVLEVGMGGAMDATNVIDTPEVAVITNIGLDHTEYLGNTLEEIAATKAGIFKENGHAVIYRGSPSVEKVFEDICAQKHIQLEKADFEGLVLHSHGLEGQVFDCGSRKGLQLPLLGSHQLKNAAVVLRIVDTLQQIGWRISEENVRAGLQQVEWPGRFDIVGREPLFIINGGHNPQCFEALIDNIRDYLPGKKLIALTGVLADKDYADMYRPIMPYVDRFVCITPPNPRKLEAMELAKHLQQAGAEAQAAESIEAGVTLARSLAGKDGVVLCFGSLYTIGATRDALLEIENKL